MKCLNHLNFQVLIFLNWHTKPQTIPILYRSKYIIMNVCIGCTIFDYLNDNNGKKKQFLHYSGYHFIILCLCRSISNLVPILKWYTYKFWIWGKYFLPSHNNINNFQKERCFSAERGHLCTLCNRVPDSICRYNIRYYGYYC